MKILHFTSGRWGFSFFDFLAVVFVVVMLAYLIAPFTFNRNKTKQVAKKAQCLNNQRQVGLAMNDWASAEGRIFPMSLSTKHGGSMEYIEKGAVYGHFLTVSTRMDGPQLLVCPADNSRQRVSKWNEVKGNSNVSYFINIDARPLGEGANGILTGDRCITGGVSSAGLMLLTSNSPAGWAYNIHPEGGVIGLSDGTVQQVTSAQLRKKLQAATNDMIKLAIP